MDLIELEFVSGANNNIKPSNDVPWRVLVIASEWYDDLLENWLYWFDKLSLDMEVILVAEDDFIANKYSNYSNLKLISISKKEVIQDMNMEIRSEKALRQQQNLLTSDV